MPRIHALPRSVINIIAAGEVVERPAVVVKELMENALDAGATQLTIRLEKSGLKKITISDNGHGMDVPDLKLSILRHTTSKIADAPDLEKIATFGFRGEALASIASVARLSMASRPLHSPSGYQITVENGQIIEETPVGMPPGTVVTVEDLFATVPARLKFLKSAQTELRLSISAVLQAALAHPEVTFQLYHHDKVVLSLPAEQSPLERTAQLLQQPTHQLLPLHFNHTFFTAEGFLGTPQLARRSKTHQFLFINRRPVSHTPLTKLVKELYGSLLDPRSEPLFVIHLHLPARLLDVNIHPRKEAVAFMDEAQILELVERAVRHTLENQDLTYEVDRTVSVGPWQLRDSAPQPLDRTASGSTAQALKHVVKPWQVGQVEVSEQPYILQVHNTYLMTQTPTGFLMIDQHAAHERILFEQFKQALASQAETPEVISLEVPALIAVSAPESELLDSHLALFHQLGLNLEPFGQHTFRLTTLPALLQDRHPTKLIREILDDLVEGKPVKGVDSIAERTLAYLACRSAIKAGDPLTQAERQQLLTKLAETTPNTTCPHGRPITITFELKDLEKIFKRR
jgi:DNA mismatch repair protein MutL